MWAKKHVLGICNPKRGRQPKSQSRVDCVDSCVEENKREMVRTKATNKHGKYNLGEPDKCTNKMNTRVSELLTKKKDVGLATVKIAE